MNQRRDESFVLTGERRIDCVPELMIDHKQTVRYRLDLTEAQVKYITALVEVDEGEHAEMAPAMFDELQGMLVYHRQGIDGPPSGGM